jgi:hypothetical protein
MFGFFTYLALAKMTHTMLRPLLLLSFCFLLFYPPYLSAQPLQKFQGKLQNGYTDAGDISYSFRPDPKTKEHIRQGTYRYTVKAKDDQWRFNHTIAGNYSDNLKDGLWSYKINQKDFQLQDAKKYTTGTVSMDAQYAKGVPNGKWRYESSLKSRTGEKKQDKWIWGRHDSLETVIVEINFRQGTIAGPFYARLDKTYEVKGNFDENGFFDGEWVWRYPDSTITVVWENGFEMSMSITDHEGNLLHMDQHSHSVNLMKEYQTMIRSGSSKVKDSPFTLDTISLINRSSYPLTELLHTTIYNQNYFLYKQIGGDKTVYYDNQSYRMRFTIRGMYLIQARNQISGTQVQHYSRMEAVITRMEAQMGYIYQMRREGKLSRQASDAIKLMEHNITLSRRYQCNAETMKLYMNHQDGLNAAENACAYLPASIGKLPSFRSKEDALQHFSTKIAELEKENQTHYNNIRKNMVQ